MNRRNPRVVADASSSSSKKLRIFSSGNDDRISDLPENLLHHILSFLNMEQVVQTSVLSKRWRFLWCSLPFLKFDVDQYISHRRRNSFNVFVDQVLLQRDNSNIHRLNLACSSENHLNAWVLYALRFNVQEVRLLVRLDGGLFRLPHRLFTCTTLTILALSHWCSQSCAVLNLPGSINLPVLKSLHFQFISFEGDDDSINKLFSSCPLLEILNIRNCEFRRNKLKIVSPRLRHLKMEKYTDNNFKGSADGSVMIYAPSLISFICKDFASKSYSGDLPSLFKADIEMGIEEKDCSAELKEKCIRHMIKFMTVIQSVKDLTLSDSVLQILSRAYVLKESSSCQLSNLRCLKLVIRLSTATIRGITYMLKICPNVETLSLLNYVHADLKLPLVDQINFDSANIGDDSEGELSSEWSLLHLKRVDFRRVMGSVHEVKLLQVVLKRSLVLEKLFVRTHESLPEVHDRISENMMEFLKDVQHVKALFLSASVIQTYLPLDLKPPFGDGINFDSAKIKFLQVVLKHSLVLEKLLCK